MSFESAAANERISNDPRWHWLAAGIIALAACSLPARAQAQCGGPTSSCRDCHENRGAGPFIATQVWHADHALGDFCSNCHGGAPAAADERAHDGLADPLSRDGERCQLCHADRPRIFERYVALLKSAEIPRWAHGSERPSPQPLMATRATAQSRPRRDRNAICVGAIIMIGLIAAAYIAERERGAGVLRHRLLASFRRSQWSAYAAGSLLGLVATISTVAFQRRLSGSGAYQELAGPLGRALSPNSVYWTQVVRPTEHWNSLVLAGAVVGALIAALLGGRFRIRWLPDSQWLEVFGKSIGKRWLIAGLGAALTGLGAGIAGGCTASLAVSGGAALAPGAFAFMAGMFASGIPTARLIYRRHPR